MWKKAVVACFKVLYLQSPGGTGENLENCSEGNLSRADAWTREM